MSDESTYREPAVSVVMPVHNADRYVGEAIQSILDQTFADFEFIIVNDGSTDSSEHVIKSFNDPRIRYHRIENRGIAGALNEGIKNAGSPLIARFDADDVALPQRLFRQVKALQEDPQLGLIGTWAIVMEEDGTVRGDLHHPIKDAELKFALLFTTPFVHPSVMFRRSVLEQTGPYDTTPGILEDYDMWSRMARVTRLANLPEDLIKYRAVKTGFSHTTTDMERKLVQQRTLNWKALVPEISDRELELVIHMGLRHSRVDLKELARIRQIFHSLIDGWTNDPEERKLLRTRARAYLMGFHVIGHGDILGKALDRSIKWLALGPSFNS